MRVVVLVDGVVDVAEGAHAGRGRALGPGVEAAQDVEPGLALAVDAAACRARRRLLLKDQLLKEALGPGWRTKQDLSGLRNIVFDMTTQVDTSPLRKVVPKNPTSAALSYSWLVYFFVDLFL